MLQIAEKIIDQQNAKFDPTRFTAPTPPAGRSRRW
jgi:non-homologous end joining protein Ku